MSDSRPLPQGFRVGAVHAGIKGDARREDVAIFLADRPCAAAGVYTTNRVFAAPVALDRQRTPSDTVRGVVVNSGNANACTGDQGERDAATMVRWAAEACGVPADSMLVMSTGIIGEPLPMEKVAAGIAQAAQQLGDTIQHVQAAQRGLMTTDTREKLCLVQATVAGTPLQLTGLAKGAGMIGPRMATMLGVVLTDAPLAAEDLQAILHRVAEQSFNCVSVEGHMSTNDTLLVLASGAAGGERLQGEHLAVFEQLLLEVCVDLARKIADDGEGATHLVEITVAGTENHPQARQIAQTIANSPLVKTAIAGHDPNWGRIVSAAGYAGVEFQVSQTSLELNQHLLFEQGQPVAFDADAVSRAMAQSRQTSVRLTVGTGPGQARFWTCDLTVDYVHINADYHT